MARVKITGIKNLGRRVKTEVGRALKRDRTFEKVTKKLFVDEVRAGVEPGLETSTINQRGRLAKVNKTHPKYSQRKSNLTFTGAFLESFVAKFQISGFRLFFTPKGKHPKITTRETKFKSGKRKGKTKQVKSKSVKNSDILEGQNALGREVTQVFERDRLTDKIAKLIKLIVKRNFKL